MSILVSSTACREFGSFYSILITGKKLNKLENQQFLDFSVGEVRSKVKLLPFKLKKQVNTESHNLLQQKLISRNFCGNHCLDRKTSTVIDKLLQAECG